MVFNCFSERCPPSFQTLDPPLSHGPKIIVITESWCIESIGDAEICLHDYVLYRCDRCNTTGGGVLLYVLNSLQFESCTPLNDLNIYEAVWCTIQLRNNDQMLVGGGQSTFATICSLVGEDTLKGTKYADLIKVLSEHYDPTPSSIVQRYKFYNRVRAEGETVDNYVASLQAIAKYCD